MFLTRELPFLRTLGIPILVSIAGETAQEFETLAEWLKGERDVAGLELNVSCPNVESGLEFGVDPKMTHDLVRRVRAVTPLPLFVKLTPNVGDITLIARAAEDAGADGLSVINAVLGMAIDATTRRSKLGTPTGGLSGPGIKPIAVRMVWQVARACRLPIIGVGGITTAEDVVEFLLAGAQAVAVASAAIDRPQIASELQTGLNHYLSEQGLANVRDLVGAVDVEGLEGRADL
jgi:dihydroorotate dehydrogenase (NAD+) catalytic subunit